ncbi:hypothetical protein SAMN04488092_105213 [Thalassovita taeanensis]|uniref:Uncharacterized protein n=1 Tax=Thalassovita taeanensis TaxID=657014 RepID=A0A1H9EXU3_9RHOB|nr:hypothetical protein SAMN04488092_105213 [Thalassovita taeanensis]
MRTWACAFTARWLQAKHDHGTTRLIRRAKGASRAGQGYPMSESE